ncbi:uncharacterized protein LOC128636136 [Bombina bombina]|uniref:uncharacterized protein LOC128636136 n=1 Tax=Bombina bombina TaxID=8345 RepID=UPI00235AAC98|nr:uncharacterized protein LOC128636136 [Bombina bombina]
MAPKTKKVLKAELECGVAPKRKKVTKAELEECARLRAILDKERHSRPLPIRPEESNMWDPVIYVEEKDDQVDPLESDSATKGKRKGNTDWCKCEHCLPVTEEEESVCCKEISKILPFLKSGEECVCEVNHLINRILDPEHIQNLHMFERLNKRSKYGSFSGMRPRDYRKVTYWAFTKWVYGHMGPRKKRRIPACVLGLVRAQYGGDGKDLHAVDGFAEDLCAK